MTDLQVKYQTLQETARANRAQEGLKSNELSLKERQVIMDETLNPAKLQKLESEVANIDAKTDLTKIEKVQAKMEVIRKLTRAFQIPEIMSGIKKALTAGKSVTNALKSAFPNPAAAAITPGSTKKTAEAISTVSNAVSDVAGMFKNVKSIGKFFSI